MSVSFFSDAVILSVSELVLCDVVLSDVVLCEVVESEADGLALVVD